MILYIILHFAHLGISTFSKCRRCVLILSVAILEAQTFWELPTTGIDSSLVMQLSWLGAALVLAAASDVEVQVTSYYENTDCTGTIYKEDWEILDRCHQPGGDPSWAKFQCNSSHVIRDWYGDESCATAHGTVGSQVLSSSVGSCDNNGKMFKCGPLPATKVRLQMYFGSCANAVDNVQAELVRATGCRAKGAAGALSSEKWEVSDGVTTLMEYSTSDCSGTADSTTSFSCSTCGKTGGTEYRPYSCPSTTSTTGATSTAGATIDHAISATAVPFVGLIFGFMFHLDF